MHPIPNSPPPSFHSRHASPERRNRRVDPDLADAFGGDDEESDDEADDRQRLVQGTTAPAEPAGPARDEGTAQPATGRNGYSSVPQPSGAAQAGRVYGGGSQADGVFSNMSAKPERGDSENDEQPPVSIADPWMV